MEDRVTTDRTALSYWFPRLEAAGIPVPRTEILQMPEVAQRDVWAAFDGQEGPGGMPEFAEEVRAAAERVGSYPIFLRTDHTSGKHNWSETCWVPSAEDVTSHIYAIAEFSECCDFMGLPWSTWVVREFLPTIPLGTCPGFGDMPVCREFRFFVEDDRMICWHPYWPAFALEQGGCSDVDYEALGQLDDLDALAALAKAAGKAVGGRWSVDILETRRGWMVTDMAEAQKSYHWPDCTSGADS